MIIIYSFYRNKRNAGQPFPWIIKQHNNIKNNTDVVIDSKAIDAQTGKTKKNHNP